MEMMRLTETKRLRSSSPEVAYQKRFKEDNIAFYVHPKEKVATWVMNGKEVGVDIETGECMAQCTACEVKGLECDDGFCCVYCIGHNVPCVRGSTQYKVPIVAEEIAEEETMALSDLAAQSELTALPDVAALPEPMTHHKKRKNRKRGGRNRGRRSQRREESSERVATPAE